MGHWVLQVEFESNESTKQLEVKPKPTSAAK